MAQILIVTGSDGAGASIAAAAAAVHAAAGGQRTLLLSLGPAHATMVEAAGLDTVAIDTPDTLAGLWDEARRQMSGAAAQVGGDELPLIPGADIILGLLRLRELAPHYQRVVVDAGPAPGLLRALALPDALRWATRLLIGLDRGPGRSNASLARAMLPVTLLPAGATEGMQEFRVRLEAARDALLDPRRTAACYALRPDAAALAAAQLAIPALQLNGLAVAGLAAGPLLPADIADPRLRPLAVAQDAILAEARAIWPGRPLASLPLPEAAGDVRALAALGARIAAGPPARPPLATEHAGAPALVIDLPGLPPGALALALNGDELIVRIGPYRRHVLLPEEVRGVAGIRATRQGDALVVRPKG